MENAVTRAEFANFFGLDLTKDFYELNKAEINILKICYDSSTYDGRNNMGREPIRQFYYHLQKGWKKLKGAQ